MMGRVAVDWRAAMNQPKPIARRARLYDRLKIYGFDALDSNGVLRRGQKMKPFRGFAQAVRVDITEVARYLYEHDEEHWPVSDFPNITPPWPSGFYEFSLPRFTVTNGRRRDWGPKYSGTRVGVLCDTPDRPALGMRPCVCAVFLAPAHQQAPTLMGTVAFGIDDQGKYVNGSTVGSAGYNAGKPSQELEDILTGLMKPVYLANSLAHCKNVRVVDIITPKKVVEKRSKAGKAAGVTYKTLVIDGMKETLRTEGGVERNGLKKALHICRGHFATYTADKPLFGRITGTVWRPMHTRGAKGQGEVRKDYKVIADE